MTDKWDGICLERALPLRTLSFDMLQLVPPRLDAEINGYNGRLLEGVPDGFTDTVDRCGTELPHAHDLNLSYSGDTVFNADFETPWSPPSPDVLCALAARYGVTAEHWYAAAAGRAGHHAVSGGSFRRAERAKHAVDKTINHATWRERQAADYRERQLENRIRQAETELAFRTPETLRGWFAAWCGSVPENDLKNMIAAWARRFPALNGLETLQPCAGDVACEVAGEIHLRSLHMGSAQKGMNRWLVPNKLTSRNILS